MQTLFIWFWTSMVFLSIAWYGVLLFYVGVKGGSEVVQMMHDLRKNSSDERGGREPRPADVEDSPG